MSNSQLVPERSPGHLLICSDKKASVEFTGLYTTCIISGDTKMLKQITRWREMVPTHCTTPWDSHMQPQDA